MTPPAGAEEISNLSSSPLIRRTGNPSTVSIRQLLPHSKQIGRGRKPALLSPLGPTHWHPSPVSPSRSGTLVENCSISSHSNSSE